MISLFGASTLLFTAVIVTVPVLLVAPAVIVSVLFVLRLKSPATAEGPADTVTVTAVNNNVDAPNKEITVSGAVTGGHGVVAPDAQTLTITDDEGAPTVTLNLTPDEIGENGEVSTVTATLTGPSSQSVTVTVSAVAVSPAVSGDFNLSGTTLTISAGTTSSTGTVTITAVNNDVDAPDKEITVSGSASGGVTSPTSQTLTIEDDEDTPTVTLGLSPSSIGENSGVSTVTASMNRPSSEAVTVTVMATSMDVTLSTNKTLTITAGATTSTGSVTITTVNNDTDAPDKEITISGSASGGRGVAAPASQTLTITDDEALPTVTLVLTPEEIPENGGVSAITAMIDRPSSEAVTVTVSAVAVSPAVSGDFTRSGTTLTITAGATTSMGTVTITAENNNVDAPNKEITVSASASGGRGVAAPTSKTLTITDDEGAPTVTLVLNPSSINENGGVSTVTASMNRPSSEAVTVTVSANAVFPAVADNFTLDGTTLTITPGQTASMGTVRIRAENNNVDAPDKEITVSADVSGGGGAIAPAPKTLTITDDETTPTVTLTLTPTSIGEKGGVSTVTASMNRPSSEAVAVTVSVPVSGDVTQSGTILAIAASTTTSTGTVTITAVNNDVDAPNKEITVSGSASGGRGVAAPASKTLTITDEDTRGVTVSTGNLTVTEGSSANYTVELDTEPTGDVIIAVNVPSGSEVSVDDETLRFTTSNWNSPQTVTVRAEADEDAVADAPVTLSHTVSGNDYQGVSADNVTVTIIESNVPTLTIADVRGGEGDGPMAFTVTLSVASSDAVTVNYQTANGTATAGDDYTARNGTLTFSPGGALTRTISVPIINDTIDEEEEETFTVSLSNESNAMIGDASATGTIEDNDVPQVQVSFARDTYTVNEGSAVMMIVTLDKDPERAVIIPLLTSHQGGATNADYSGVSERVTFNAGETEKTFEITAIDDGIDDDNETVTLRFGNLPTRVSQGSPSTVAIAITDGDIPAVTVSFGAASYTANEGGNAVMVQVRLNADPERTVTIPLTATGRNGAETDDYSMQPANLTFNPTETVRTVTITAEDDDIDDDGETVELGFGTLPDRVSAGPVRSTTEVSLTDNDTRGVTVRPTALNVPEDGSNTYTVELTSQPTAAQVIVTVAGTSGDVSVSGSPLTFTTGNWGEAQTVTVNAADDADAVANDPVQLTHAVSGGDYGAVTADAVMVTIIENDAPILTIEDARGTEGDGNMAFEVRLSQVSSDAVRVDYATQGGTATQGTDYTATSGTLTFSPGGDLTQMIAVAIRDDALYEAQDETFMVTLSNASNAELADAEATGTIIDNDDPPTTTPPPPPPTTPPPTPPPTTPPPPPPVSPEVTVSFGETSYEATEDGQAAMVTVTLSVDPQRTVVIPLIATPGNGATPADYSGVPQNITFTSGETEKIFEVMAVDDEIDDDDETIELTFGTLPDDVEAGSLATATVSLADNDVSVVTVSFGQARYIAAEGGTAATIMVRLSADPQRTVAIPLMVTPANGATEADYSGVPERVIFDSGETEKTFAVVAVDDDIDDDDETVALSFGILPHRVNAGNLSTTTVSLADNDVPIVTVSFNQARYRAAEGGNTATVRVSLSADPKREVVIPLTVTPANGATQADYSGVPQSITFNSGETRKTFEITATDDSVDDDGETVALSFGALPDGVEAGSPATSTVSLVDNDVPVVSVSFGQARYRAAEGGSTAIVRVSLSADPEREVTIPLTATANRATDADYSGVPQSVTFTSGETEKTFEITATDDSVDDDNESITLTFGTLPEGVEAGSPATATVALIDNDVPLVSVSFDQVTYEATEGGSAAMVIVTLNTYPERTVAIPLILTPGNGATEADYSGVPERVVFSSGQKKKTFEVVAVDDDIDDDDETIALRFGTLPQKVRTGRPSTTTVSLIDNDDPIVEVSFEQANYETTEGGSAALVTLTLSADPEREVAIPLIVAPENGATDADYSGVPEQVTFNRGETEKTFEITATDDDIDDDDESMTLTFGTLPHRVNAGNLTTAIVSLIDNDDPIVEISFDRATYETTEGGSAVQVIVSLSADPERTVAIPLIATPANGATDADYAGVPEQVTFHRGETEKTFEITATDDDIDDDDETVTLSFGTLPHRVNAGNFSTAIVSLIDNDDPIVAVSFDQVTYTAQEGGSAAKVIVTLSADPERTVEIPLIATPANGATDADYSGVPESITFNRGETEKTFEVVAVNDDIDDDGETIALAFGTLPHRVNASGQSTITISDNDERGVTVSVTELAVPEGDTRTYTVVLHSAPTAPVTIDITGMANTDVSVGTAQLTFTAENWNAPQEVVVAAQDDADAVVERATLSHAISGGDYGEEVVTSVVVTIIEDDTPVITMENQSVIEHAGEMVFTVVLDIQSSNEVTVNYTTNSGTAEAGTDYTATQGTLRFAALQTEQTISVSIIDDDVDEDSETFTVTLSNAQHATLPEATATGTIEDNDAAARAMEVLLSNVGRMVATDAIDVISRRFDQRSFSRSTLTLGGRTLLRHHRARTEQWHTLVAVAHNVIQALGVDIYTPADLSMRGAHLYGMNTGVRTFRPNAVNRGMQTSRPQGIVQLRRVTPWELLSRSAFNMPLNHMDKGNRWTLWGRGAASGFSGQPSAIRRMTADGFSGYIGIDYQARANVLIGLALTHSVGDLDYKSRDTVTLVPVDFGITSVLPYAHYQVHPRLGVWGLLGAGRGSVNLTDTEGTVETDLQLLMGAAGGRQDLMRWRRINFAMKADAFIATMASGENARLPEIREDVERVRVLLEARTTQASGAMSRFTQRMEIGGRWDMGRVGKGAGMDLGGGIEYMHIDRGVGLSIDGRYLLAHEQVGYGEWGAGLMLQINPGWGKPGLVLSVAPGWGAPIRSAEALWRSTPGLRLGPVYRPQRTPGMEPDRFEVDLGYRLLTHAGNGLVTPYGGFSTSGWGYQSYRIGGRMEVGKRMELGDGMALSVEGERQARGHGEAAYGIYLRGHMRW